MVARPSKEQNKPGALSDDQLKQKQSFEKQMTDRINTMIERILGPGKVTTRVAAELDMKEVVTHEDIYDPERTAVRSEQKLQERNEGAGRGAVGAPNATYELGTGNRGFSPQGNQGEVYTRSEETTNYEITNIKRQTIASSGDLKRITVSVAVDGNWVTGEDGQKSFVPLPQSQLDQLTELVKNTVGYDEARGDRVTVSSTQFYQAENLPVWTSFLMEFLREFYRPFLNILLILCFFFFVVRPIINWLKKEVEPTSALPEPAVLPELPSGPRPGAEGLPLPAAGEGAARLESEGPTLANLEHQRFGEESLEEEVPSGLLKGHLNRENMLPLARENMDKTIGQLRNWIEDKPLPPAGGHQG